MTGIVFSIKITFFQLKDKLSYTNWNYNFSALFQVRGYLFYIYNKNMKNTILRDFFNVQGKNNTVGITP